MKKKNIFKKVTAYILLLVMTVTSLNVGSISFASEENAGDDLIGLNHIDGESIELEDGRIVTAEELEELFSMVDIEDVVEEELTVEDVEIIKDITDEIDSADLYDIIQLSKETDIIDEHVDIEDITIEDIEEVKDFINVVETDELTDIINNIDETFEEDILEDGLGDYTVTLSDMSVAVPSALKALFAFIAGIKYVIPYVGPVLVISGGAYLVYKNRKQIVKVGSSIWNSTVNFLKPKANSVKEKYEYDVAKRNGSPTKKHSVHKGSSLPVNGKPRSSRDLRDSKGLKQRRYYDERGRADVDIDYRHAGKMKFPHRHTWKDGKRSGH
ncbi:MAG: hypothetical protein WAO56_04530 [Miniphocaeibacter sp.]|uniref:hypothetical protein n=1 Tax=Miniphocaeibacter sp. TaxID=3100973 RepID=UPI0017AB1CA7|nr:hypothetical protein [Gallicola sp.]